MTNSIWIDATIVVVVFYFVFATISLGMTVAREQAKGNTSAAITLLIIGWISGFALSMFLVATLLEAVSRCA